MAYAVIKSGNKQYRVSVGELLDVEKLDVNEGDAVTFSEVLAVGEGAGLKLGQPFVAGATVEGKVLNQFKAPKVTAFKFKRRKGYARKKGHRQRLTKVEITAING